MSGRGVVAVFAAVSIVAFGWFPPAGADETQTSSNIVALTASGRVLYAVTAEKGGLYRSDDNGASWSPGGMALPPAFLSSAVALADGSLVVTAHEGVFRTTDGGAVWTPLSTTPAIRAWPTGRGDVFARPWGNGLTLLRGKTATVLTGAGRHVMDLATGPDGLLWAGGLRDGVAVSADGGVTWRLDTEGLVNRDVLAVAVTAAGTVLAGTHAGGVFRRDGAVGWRRDSFGLPERSSVQVLAALPDGRVAAGTHGDGLFLSDDDGRTWRRLGGSERGLESVTALLSRDDGTLLVGTRGGGLKRADIARDSFRPVPLRTPVAAVAEGAAGTAFAILDDGTLFGRRAGGGRWTGIGSVGGAARSIHVSADGTVVAGTAKGVLLSDDGGRTWRAGGLDAPVAAFAAAGPDALFAAAGDGRLHRSPDGGRSWQAVATGFEDRFTTLAGAVWGRSGDLLVGTDSGLLSSSDGGRNWTFANVTYGVWASAAGCPGGTFIARWTGPGLFQAPPGADKGFQEVSAWGPGSATIRVGAIACPADGALVATTAKGIERLEPAAGGWKSTGSTLANVDVRAILAVADGNLLAATDRGLFASADHGHRWSLVPLAW